MKFEFYDHTTGTQLIAVDTLNTEFGSNIFNLFMVEMLRLHGPSFKEMRARINADGNIDLVYTNNITAVVHPD